MHAIPTSSLDYRRLNPAAIAAILAVLLAFRFWLAAVFPFTGDEAYFTIWGLKPDLGYYDHPPMVGWWLAVLTRLSAAEWVWRLPAILLPGVIGLGIYLAMRGISESRARWAALAYLLVPVNVWNVFVTTDTPLVLWCFLAGTCWWRARSMAASSAAVTWHALAGVFLGLAFLSKYFSALLLLAFLADGVLAPRGSRPWRGLLVTVLCATPFGLLNLWWNYENCWANLMFNVYNRHDDAGFSWKSPLVYLFIAVYVLSPIALWQIARGRARLRERWSDPAARFLFIAVALPFAIFSVLSLVRSVGLHWVFAFMPFFFMACVVLLNEAQLRVSVIFLAGFSGLHVVAALVGAALPLDTWKNTRWHDGIVFHARIKEVAATLKTFQPEFELAADGYSPATTASLYAGSYVFVFGTASSHARHDDLLTDFRSLDGKNILVFRKNPPSEGDYRPYFASVEFGTMKIAGATFHLVFGKGFNYPAYRDGVLATVRDRYYRIPRFLPQGGCSFCERYFSNTCPVR